MKNLPVLTILILSSLLLSGCLKKVEEIGWGNFNKPQEIETKVTPDSQDMQVEQMQMKQGLTRIPEVGIPACDSYLQFVACTTEHMDTQTAQQIMDQVTADWAQLDTETLTATCQQKVKEVQESPQQYTNGLNCSIAI